MQQLNDFVETGCSIEHQGNVFEFGGAHRVGDYASVDIGFNDS